MGLGFNHSARGGDRVALVIGNQNYENALDLTNPINDARDLKLALEANGHKVTLGTDLDARGMARTLSRWKETARNAESALFFYAGHGIEVDGTNYLLPTDANLEEKGDLSIEAVALDQLLDTLEDAGARLKIIILDCCRDDPFLKRGWRRTRSQSTGGLAEVNRDSLPTGTLLVFSGAPNQSVPDGRGRNSPFTTEFLTQLKRPGMPVTSLFSEVARKVKSGQEPWITIDGSGRSFAAFGNYRITLGVPAADSMPDSSPSEKKPSSNMTPGTRIVPDQYGTVQAAINAAESGDVILIRAGVYRERLRLSNFSQIELRGENRGSTIIRAPDSEDDTIIFSGVESGSISNLTIELPTTTTRAKAAKLVEENGALYDLLFLSGGRLSITNCRFAGGYEMTGFRVRASGTVTITGSEFVDCLIGIAISEKGSQAVIRDNKVSRSIANGISVFDSSSAVLEENECTGNGYDGIFINGEASAELTGNRCLDNDLSGMSVYNSATATLRENLATGNKNHGIFVYLAEATLTENTCRDNGLQGIIFTEKSTGSADGNQCSQNGDSGIFVAGEDTSAELTNNYCQENQIAGITVKNAAFAKVVGNRCENNNGSGILIFDASPLVENNRCIRNTYSGIAAIGSGSRPRIIGNMCNDNKQFGIGVETVCYPAEFRDNQASGNGDNPQINRKAEFEK